MAPKKNAAGDLVFAVIAPRRAAARIEVRFAAKG
jgi:hypothetical protein